MSDSVTEFFGADSSGNRWFIVGEGESQDDLQVGGAWIKTDEPAEVRP